MTTTSTSPKVDPKAEKLTAAEKAYQRRSRRTEKMTMTLGQSPALERAKITAKRVPFVAVLVGLLGAGLAGILWLNTLTDEAGIRTNAAAKISQTLRLEIESLSSDIAVRNATPAIAQAARGLGLVPAGDSAILVIGTDGAATVIGTPTPVVDPAVVAGQAAAEAAAAAAQAQAAADSQAAAAAQAAAAQAAAVQAAAVQAAAAAASNTAGQPPAADPAAVTTQGAAG